MQKIKTNTNPPVIPDGWFPKPEPTHFRYLDWLVNLQQFQFFIYKTKKS